MTLFFDRRLSLLFLFLCLPLLFLPKINLISFEGRETAGLRWDDLVLLAFSCVIFGAKMIQTEPFNKVEKWMAWLIGFSLFSYFSNQVLVANDLLKAQAVLVYVFRILEYFLFFYIGVEAARWVSLPTLMRAFFAWNLVIMVLQKLGVIGGFLPEGYESDVAWRCCGIGSFASETGLLLNMLFCYFAFAEDGQLDDRWLKLVPPSLRQTVQQSYIYILFAVFAFLLLINGSRIALVALGVSFLARVFSGLSWRSPLGWLFFFVFLAGTVWAMKEAIMAIEALGERSEGLLSWDNLSIVPRIYDSVSLEYDPIGSEGVSLEDADQSWWLRIHKWSYAIKMYVTHPWVWVQGVGPGFAMAGLDGGFLRVIVEYGIIGSFLFYTLFREVYRQSRAMKWCIIVFCINMIFFDVYLAYKPMSFLFLIMGYTYNKKYDTISVC